MVGGQSRCRFWAVAGILFLGGLAGCSKNTRTHAITDVREARRPFGAPVHRASTAERFGLSGHNDPGHGAPGHQHGEQAPLAGGQELAWDLPTGWSELAPTSMRQANFRVSEQTEIECYLTVLPGGAGGLEANVNRWRSQMGLAPFSPQEIEELPTRELFGRDAVFLELEGGFSGMGDETRNDYRMIGLILEQSANTIFLKMVGPAEAIRAEQQNFDALAASFRIEEQPALAQIPTGEGAHGMVWEVPGGWMRGPDKAMRVVTLMPQGAPDTECYVTILAGDAGGGFANVNRWRGQMGLSPLTLADYEALPRRSVLGIDSVLVEMEGSFTGMSGGSLAEAAMFGVISEQGQRTLFIKMTGPRERVLAERESFLSFCDSLDYGEDA